MKMDDSCTTHAYSTARVSPILHSLYYSLSSGPFTLSAACCITVQPKTSLAQPSSTLIYPTLPYSTLHNPNPTQTMGCAQYSTSEKYSLGLIPSDYTTPYQLGIRYTNFQFPIWLLIFYRVNQAMGSEWTLKSIFFHLVLV